MGRHRLIRPGLAFSLILPAVLSVSPAGALAQEESEQSSYDAFWSNARLYEGNENTFFQSIDLSGRLQLDWAYVENQTDSHDEFNVRRFRFGFKSRFKNDFIFHVEGEFNPQEFDPLYTRLTDTYLAWEYSTAMIFTLGKHSAGFTLDGLTSSKKLLTIDRNNLTNNIWFTEEYIPGVSVKGNSGNWNYFAGLFSSGDENPEFGDFKGGEFLLLNLGHDFAERWKADEALLRLNLVFNEPDKDNGFTNMLERIASLNFRYHDGHWGFRGDLCAGAGYYGQSDLWGFVVMPYYQFSRSTELVARYTYIKSKDVNGIRFARYERSIAEGLGDKYDEIHLGFNYYWYGHKLKLQNGIQYVKMRDKADDGGAYEGWSWTTGFRISW